MNNIEVNQKKDEYIRPEFTKNDIISNDPELLHKHLKNYVQIL